MPALEWDKTGEKFYQTGISKGVLYTMTDEGIYTGGVAWNGLTGVDESPEGGDANDFYADNIKYGSITGIEKFKFTIKAYTYPDEFMKYDGTKSLAAGIYIDLQGRPMFGFSYQTLKGNDVKGTELGYLIHLVYGCKASPSSKSRQTVNENPDMLEFSWEVDSTPAAFTGNNAKLYKPVSHVIIDSTKFDDKKLETLETQLYTTGSMPSPDDLVTLIGG